MTPWYRELNQRNRLLMVAASATLEPRLTVTEFAVLTVLVNQGDRMGVTHRSWLWNRGRDCLLLDKPDRASGVGVLPYTRQGIEKACKGLVAKGWVREDYSTCYDRNRDPGLIVLPLNILSVAPSWLKPNSLGSSPGEKAAGRRPQAAGKTTALVDGAVTSRPTAVASRSLRNKRSKRPTPEDLAEVEAADAALQLDPAELDLAVAPDADGRLWFRGVTVDLVSHERGTPSYVARWAGLERAVPAAASYAAYKKNRKVDPERREIAAKAVIADRWWPAQFNGETPSDDEVIITAFLAATNALKGTAVYDVVIAPLAKAKGGKRG